MGLVIRSLISALLKKNKKALALRLFSFFIFTCCYFITVMFERRKEEDANACSGEMRWVSEIERDCNALFCNSYLFIVAVWTFRGEPVVCMKSTKISRISNTDCTFRCKYGSRRFLILLPIMIN